ncbi:MAG: carbohydrate ABC transporter permease [Thermomicrobiales bacterium]|nr:carbohydrate ABC transporter permease [Thermomicrobiales bacterium]
MPVQNNPTAPRVLGTQPDESTFQHRKRDRYAHVFSQSILPRIFLIAMCLLFILPLYWMVVTSLKTNTELTRYPPTLFPENIAWHNYIDSVRAFTDDRAGVTFWTYAQNTLIITVLCTLGAAISNPLIAYGFSRIDWRGRDQVFFVVLATMFVPGSAILVAMFDIWVKIGQWLGIQTINTFWPLVLPAFFGNATWIFMMRQFFFQIPKDMSDAAKLDGASELKVFWQIIMPQAQAAIGAISIFAAVGAWNDFMGPLIYLQSKVKYTLALGLAEFTSASTHDVQFNQLMAASTIVVIPVIVLFLFFQKAFTEGISVAGIKG